MRISLPITLSVIIVLYRKSVYLPAAAKYSGCQVPRRFMLTSLWPFSGDVAPDPKNRFSGLRQAGVIRIVRQVSVIR